MIKSYHTLELMCDIQSTGCESFKTFTGTTFARARRNARDEGWMVGVNTCGCPSCTNSKQPNQPD